MQIPLSLDSEYTNTRSREAMYFSYQLRIRKYFPCRVQRESENSDSQPTPVTIINYSEGKRIERAPYTNGRKRVIFTTTNRIFHRLFMRSR